MQYDFFLFCFGFRCVCKGSLIVSRQFISTTENLGDCDENRECLRVRPFKSPSQRLTSVLAKAWEQARSFRKRFLMFGCSYTKHSAEPCFHACVCSVEANFERKYKH